MLSEIMRRGAAVTLDLRPQGGRGEEPVGRVLETLDGLLPGSLLLVLAPSAAGALEALLASRGHRTSTVVAPDGTLNLVCVVGGAPEVVDLRDLEPPEPLERVLSLSARLARGGVLLAHLPRNPRLLLPHLASRGLPHEVLELTDGSALVRVGARP